MNLQEKDRKYLWHPYTQMKDYAHRDLLIIDRAQGLMLYDEKGREYFDTISSWWCILHGHNHPDIKAAILSQLDRLEQVLLAGTSHEPAILLAEQLVQCTPEPLTKVFFSDNGSTACEVAVKMSIQYWRQSGQPKRHKIVAIERGYHGDTIGTMSLGGVPEFHEAFGSMMFESHRIPSPYCYRCPMGNEKDSCDLECLVPLQELLENEGETIAAFILEPLIQAAGGMIVYPGRYLARAVEIVRKFGAHIIFDEVATGFGRTGRMFAMDHQGVVPDFLCLSKGLTAGALPMAATLVTEEVYQGFYADYSENKTFFHGHTFTGNPLSASAALGSLKVFSREKPFSTMQRTVPHLKQRMQRFLDLPWVGDFRHLGMIAAIELVKDKQTKKPFDPVDRVGWKIYLKGLEKGLLLRPLGNIIYLWLPLSTTISEIDEITERTWQVLSNPENISGFWKKPGRGIPTEKRK
ncbi:MAG: adenosylmethionine--8-amino-7-oxononanoate transaminase [Proteobacteria bacterium]|nr:adenosylmethionine--8-amino-7-oxononanoate transaminase [Pseudomonadota bacterium]MBU1708607.1 adenosylmethionine--8-amino-7-oxononanoate transaminase [Pseudomonadota bacterium]